MRAMPRIENSFFMRFKMAIRGQRPTATIVKLARGNPGKRRIRDDEPIASGRPVKPPKLRGRAAKLWDEVVEFAFWLAAADSYSCTFGANCKLNSNRIQAGCSRRESRNCEQLVRNWGLIRPHARD